MIAMAAILAAACGSQDSTAGGPAGPPPPVIETVLVASEDVRDTVELVGQLDAPVRLTAIYDFAEKSDYADDLAAARRRDRVVSLLRLYKRCNPAEIGVEGINRQTEQAKWEVAVQVDTVESYNKYLSTFPDGHFQTQAFMKIAEKAFKAIKTEGPKFLEDLKKAIK